MENKDKKKVEIINEFVKTELHKYPDELYFYDDIKDMLLDFVKFYEKKMTGDPLAKAPFTGPSGKAGLKSPTGQSGSNLPQYLREDQLPANMKI